MAGEEGAPRSKAKHAQKPTKPDRAGEASNADRARERYAEDPIYRARRQAISRAYYHRKREMIIYEKRIRYWKGDREKMLEQTRRARTPEAKQRYAERAQSRAAKAAERRRSKYEYERLEGLRGHAIRDLERPAYKIRRGGTTTPELWPLDDDAARWLRIHDKSSTPAQGT